MTLCVCVGGGVCSVHMHGIRGTGGLRMGHVGSKKGWE